jgi:actin-related protein
VIFILVKRLPNCTLTSITLSVQNMLSPMQMYVSISKQKIIVSINHSDTQIPRVFGDRTIFSRSSLHENRI